MARSGWLSARSQSASTASCPGPPTIRRAARNSPMASAHSPARYATRPTVSRTTPIRPPRARAARARGGRIGVVRETVGLVAYRAGEWAEAIGELRAARRMVGGPGQLAVLADCERALNHPERAIELARSARADELDQDAAIELSIVVAGARADLDQVDAALAHLERVGLDATEAHPRLAYAYADLLLKAGRNQEALSWFIRAANVDAEEETDALERVEALGEDESIDAELADAELTDAGLVIDVDLAAELPAADSVVVGDVHTGDALPVDVAGADLADIDLSLI